MWSHLNFIFPFHAQLRCLSLIAAVPAAEPPLTPLPVLPMDGRWWDRSRRAGLALGPSAPAACFLQNCVKRSNCAPGCWGFYLRVGFFSNHWSPGKILPCMPQPKRTARTERRPLPTLRRAFDGKCTWHGVRTCFERHAFQPLTVPYPVVPLNFRPHTWALCSFYSML